MKMVVIKREVFIGRFMEFCGILWNFIEFYGILKLIIGYFSFEKLTNTMQFIKIYPIF
jgi:hypothetical protein